MLTTKETFCEAFVQQIMILLSQI